MRILQGLSIPGAGQRRLLGYAAVPPGFATMKVVTLFSGGTGSYAAAMRVADQYGPENQVLLFTDTNTEDADLYRFIEEAAGLIGSELITIADGRDVWQVFNDEKFIGNTRVDICSRILKRDLARRWIEEHTTPETHKVAMGIDWTEIHRFERARPRWEPWELIAPLCDKPYIDKQQIHADLKARGVEIPRLYAWSPHNNCGGFCVKGGHGQFKALLVNMPERYKYHEEREQEFREEHDADVAILRDRTGGETRPLTMREFRERIEAEDDGRLQLDEWGGCGCMVDF